MKSYEHQLRVAIDDLLMATDSLPTPEPELVSARQQGITLLRRGRRWSKTGPCEAGWYWCMDPSFEEGEPHPVRVFKEGITVTYYRDGAFIGNSAETMWCPMDQPGESE